MVPGKAMAIADMHARPTGMPAKPKESPTMILEIGFPRKVDFEVGVIAWWGVGLAAK